MKKHQKYLKDDSVSKKFIKFTKDWVKPNTFQKYSTPFWVDHPNNAYTEFHKAYELFHGEKK